MGSRAQGAEVGLWVIHRAAKLTREWGGQIHVAKLDIQRAFDSLRHGAILNALRQDGLHPAWIGATAHLLREQTIVARIGTHDTESIPLFRGL
eukprot:4276707-Prorocentrum_lima.AAC.1